MPSTTARGNYYKKKTKEWFEKRGYETQLTEFNCGRMIAPGKMIYVKKDVFSSDGISMNGKEIIFWNSKHSTSKDSERHVIGYGKEDYKRHNFPPFVKRQLVVWQLRRKEPEIIDCPLEIIKDKNE